MEVQKILVLTVECCRGRDPNVTGSQGLEGKMSIFSNHLGCGGAFKGFFGKSAGGGRGRPFSEKEVDPRDSVAPSMVENSERDEPVCKGVEEDGNSTWCSISMES